MSLRVFNYVINVNRIVHKKRALTLEININNLIITFINKNVYTFILYKNMTPNMYNCYAILQYYSVESSQIVNNHLYHNFKMYTDILNKKMYYSLWQWFH